MRVVRDGGGGGLVALLLVAVVVVLLLTGCRQAAYELADDRILFDKEGCAFAVEAGIGSTSFVKRMKDVDLEGCKLP
jgi:hypothetical protein